MDTQIQMHVGYSSLLCFNKETVWVFLFCFFNDSVDTSSLKFSYSHLLSSSNDCYNCRLYKKITIHLAKPEN